VDRYVRHTVMPWFGDNGQATLRGSTVLIVGCGGTGCTCSSFLARAGIGKIRIVDPDVVGMTDLHRQLLFTEKDVDDERPKVEVVAERLNQANSEVALEPVMETYKPENAESLAAGVDLIMDCSDNFETRMLLNEVCTRLSKPWVHGACVGTAGIIIPFPLCRTACYRCIVDHIPKPAAVPTCEGAGILGPLAGAVGCIEAAEGIKVLVNPEGSRQRLIYIDATSGEYETIEVRKRDDCPVCGSGVYEFLEGRRPWGRGPCVG
jgi:adenylyltransferase/sulfurtransferase